MNESKRPARGMRLTPKGLAAGCLLAAAHEPNIGEEAGALARNIVERLFENASAEAVLPDVRRLRAMLGEHPVGAKIDREALPWFEQAARSST